MEILGSPLDTVSSLKNTGYDADESASYLTEKIQNQEPFIFIRYGDGAIECIFNINKHTCDGEVYTPELAEDLIRCWCLLCQSPLTHLGDWFAASYVKKSENTIYGKEFKRLIDIGTLNGRYKPMWLHCEALLLMCTTPALLGFYRAIRNDPRKKLLMGPAQMEAAARILKCDFLSIPVVPHIHKLKAEIKDQLDRRDFDVLLFGAGMGGNIPVVDHWMEHQDRTYIHLGSALDSVCWKKTRWQQLPPPLARSFFEQVLL